MPWFSLKCAKSQLYNRYTKNYRLINDRLGILPHLHPHLPTLYFQNSSMSRQRVNRSKGLAWKGNWELIWIWKGLSKVGSSHR